MLAYVDPEFESMHLSLRVSIPGVEELLEQRYLCGGLHDILNLSLLRGNEKNDPNTTGWRTTKKKKIL